jgi:hypothetical protein
MTNIIIRNTDLKALSSQLDFILLDGSGSMRPKWWDMLGAIDKYIAGLKAEMVDSHIRLDIFDDTALDLTARDVHISKWRTFDVDPIGAHFGGTPLYDAIVLMGRNIRDLNPTKGCAVTIVTDGENGHNKFADLPQAKGVLDWLRAQGFSVTFIGCDFDNTSQARMLGADAENSVGVRKELLGPAAASLAKKRAHYARTGEQVAFSEDERQKFGGYLSHTKG